MSNQATGRWDHRMADLSHITEDAEGRRSLNLPEPPGWLVLSAASLLRQLQCGGAVPADRVCYVLPEKIHFEWYSDRINLVIAVIDIREAEVVWYSRSGDFYQGRYRW